MKPTPFEVHARAALRVVPAVVLVCLLAAPPPAAAATGSAPASSAYGDLTGTVYDASGLPLIGALINVIVPGDGPLSTAVTITDRRGRFVVRGLPAGVYTLMARSVGFVQAVLPGVTIPREEPVSLQLRPEPALTLLSADSSLDLGWVYRPGVRDILRSDDGPILPVLEEEQGGGSWLAVASETLGLEDLGGEVSLWAVAPFTGTENDSGSATDLALGARRDGRSLIVRAQVADGGVVRARSDVTDALTDSHVLRFGVGYAGKDVSFPGVPDQAERMWVGSLAAEDHWKLADELEVTYGLRFEHYSYLEESGVMSPRIQVTYAPVESLVFSTGVAYEAEAPGIAELRFEIDPLAVRHMDILTSEGLEPERALRYTVGVESEAAGTRMRARAFYGEIENELLGLRVSDRTAGDYLVFNLGESVTKGFELNVRRTFLDSVAGDVSYSYGRRSAVGASPDLVAQRPASSSLPAAALSELEIDTIHEIKAGLETVVGAYDTRLRAVYSWKRGVPVIDDGVLDDVYDRLDLRVRQPLPFRLMASEWAALVQVQNVLGRDYEGVYDLGLDDVPILSRLVAGGLAVRF